MSPPFLIKNFSAGDIPALYALVQACRHGTEEAYFERSLLEQDEGKRLVFVAEAGGSLIGYVQYNRFPKYKPFSRLGIPEIQDLFVHPDLRRQGIGLALMAACEAQAKTDGCSDIGIGVGVSSSFGNAQRLYMARGYRPDGAGVVYDREAVQAGQLLPLDDNLCLMLLKGL